MIDKNIIQAELINQGYSERSARLVADELIQLSPELLPCFDAWMNGDNKDFVSNGYTILQLMKERGMTYPAALLTIDWLIKDPERAKASLNKGIK